MITPSKLLTLQQWFRYKILNSMVSGPRPPTVTKINNTSTNKKHIENVTDNLLLLLDQGFHIFKISLA